MSPSVPETHIVTPEEAGWRLDRVLAAMRGVGSRRRAREVLASGKVEIDGEPVGSENGMRPVRAGSIVSVDWNRPGTAISRVKAMRGLREAGLRILYEDANLVAVDKPPGLLTDTADRWQSQEEDSLARRLGSWLRARGDRLEMVHRIDRDTSGVVLVACNPRAAASLRNQFRAHSPERVYRAIVHGILPPFEEGEWADWMRWDGHARVQRPCEAGVPGAVLARARYRVLGNYRERASLLEIRLITGRRNQIRVHLMLRRMPLVGERLYLPPGWKDPDIDAPRQALHALRLMVRHPETGAEVRIDAPWPKDLVALERRLGFLRTVSKGPETGKGTATPPSPPL